MEVQTESWSCRGLLGKGQRALDAAGVASPRLDAEVLLAAVMQCGRAALYARLQDHVSDDVAQRFWSMIRRRQRREPVAYITGVREFWSLPLFVSPAVLIPRPETELVVEAACELLANRHGPLVCDIGTGSGCIAVALATEHPTARIVATDVSPAALAVARRNAHLHRLGSRVQFVCSDLFEGIAAHVEFDLVVSNPPYVPSASRLMEESSYEPETALFAGESGLDTIRRLLCEVPSRLRDGARVVMELGDGQEPAVGEIARASALTPLEMRRDLAGVPRVLVARRSGEMNG